MLENIKLMLGSSADNYTDEQIKFAYKRAVSEVEAYCRRELTPELAITAEEIAVIKLNRLGTEGLSSQGYSGVSESYLDGYPEHIKKILNSKRLLKTL